MVIPSRMLMEKVWLCRGVIVVSGEGRFPGRDARDLRGPEWSRAESAVPQGDGALQTISASFCILAITLAVGSTLYSQSW